ncbi:MAG: hypothetical protein ACREQZ_14085, partial [Woeseiaceae bacterium]
IALYAAACELYIFLFTVTAGSISVSLLYRLRAGALSETQIEALLGGRNMVDRRVKNMLAVGLLEQARDGYVRTTPGGLTLWAYRALRRFFWRTPLLPSLIKRTDPGSLPNAVTLKSLGENALACLLLVGAVVAVFWAHFSGRAIFIGDSDRLNHYLTILRVLTDGYRDGTVPTWDDLIFGGFDLVSFTHPYPTSLLHLLWPPEELVFAAGNVSALLLAASACAAYAFFKDASRRTFPSLVGAALYAMSALSILKISQNDISFSAFVVMPIMMLIIRRARADNSAASFVGLTAALTYLLVFAFLQKAAYVLLLGAAYAIYRSYRARTLRTAAVFGLSGLTSVVAAFPRIYSMGEEFLSSARHQFIDAPAANLRAAAVTESYEVLRWFDDRIFGPFAAEVAVRNAGVNLHEGFLLYMSTFAALLVLFMLVRKLVAWTKDHALHLPEATFHIGVVAFCFLVILTAAGDQLMYHAFLRIDFIHARIAIIALLPLCALVVLSLLTLYPPQEHSVSLRIGMLLASGSAAVVALLLIDAFAGRFEATYLPIRWPGANALVFISASAAARILLSVAVFCVVLTMHRVFRSEGVVKQIAVYALGFLMFGQVFIYAKNQIAGEHMRSPGAMPFAKHIRLLAEPGDFHGPSSAAVEALRNRLEADNYRSSIICDPGRTAIYCSTHIAHFWRLRMVDGYLNAVPTRIAALPFGNGTLGARVLRFATLEQLPWPLLAMLNVKYVLEADRALFTNVVTLPDGRARELRPDDIRVAEN